MWLDRGDLPTPSAVPSLPKDLPYVILGDAAYPLRKDLMTPYGSNLTHERKIYNYRHSRARRCVENAFGILAAKWRVLRTAIKVDVESATSIVLAAVVLHNFVLHHEPFPKDDIEPWIPVRGDGATNNPLLSEVVQHRKDLRSEIVLLPISTMMAVYLGRRTTFK